MHDDLLAERGLDIEHVQCGGVLLSVRNIGELLSTLMLWVLCVLLLIHLIFYNLGYFFLMFRQWLRHRHDATAFARHTLATRCARIVRNARPGQVGVDVISLALNPELIKLYRTSWRSW
jgi:hypothetical protein